jgi:hypothetical protein
MLEVPRLIGFIYLLEQFTLLADELDWTVTAIGMKDARGHVPEPVHEAPNTGDSPSFTAGGAVGRDKPSLFIPNPWGWIFSFRFSLCWFLSGHGHAFAVLFSIGVRHDFKAGLVVLRTRRGQDFRCKSYFLLLIKVK